MLAEWHESTTTSGEWLVHWAQAAPLRPFLSERSAHGAWRGETKREAVELGLRTIVRPRKQEEIRRFRGKLKWQGDLDAMRTD
jgi:hypothetical protein